MFPLDPDDTLHISTEYFKTTIDSAGGQCHPPKVVEKVVFFNQERALNGGWRKETKVGRILQNANGFGTDNRLVPIFYIHLAIDRGQVPLDCLGRDEQAPGNLVVARSLREHPQHFDFPVGQWLNPRLIRK